MSTSSCFKAQGILRNFWAGETSGGKLMCVLAHQPSCLLASPIKEIS